MADEIHQYDRNSLADKIQYYTTSSTGWMYPTGMSISLVWWCTGVCMDWHLSTLQTTLFQPLMLLLATRLRSANLNRLTASLSTQFRSAIARPGAAIAMGRYSKICRLEW